ncbi:aspartate aminotransferase family protein [Clostridium baratii]|uniref:aspartate aminotransferase family protein n=2 Tax=Clostridium baratii TaxID=1561 RepID=UPI0005F291F6|nr:acetylornithine aminotransferase [Clostridium baratii]
MIFMNYLENSLMNTYSPFPIVFTKGYGTYLYDTLNNKYLDFTSGIGVNSLGYCDKDLTDTIVNQAKNLLHTSNIFLNDKNTVLSNKLCSISKMSKIFFSNSGAEANEGAIKLARKYSYDKYKTENRSTILTLEKSFHGRTLCTLKATGQEKFHKYFSPFPEGFKYTKANDIKMLKESLTPDVCAIMLEAIQGEGGVNPISYEFVKEIFKLCKEKDILIIFDEVQCGIGRTGKVFGFNHFDVIPDIITVAKGLGSGVPIGAFMCNEKLKDVFSPGDHGSTFGGNPLCTSAAITVVDKILNDKFLDEVTKKGDKLFSILKTSKNIVDIRGAGLMVGIETKYKASDIQKKALDKGLLVLTAGENTIRLLPPLTISFEEIEIGANILLDIIG